MASLSLRINLDPEGRIGPGKIELLERIASFGSISAAGRSMDMSYRRAWELVEELNSIFGKPVVERQTGGKNGGGARLTTFGLALIARFRAIEQAAEKAAETHLSALQTEIERPTPSGEDAFTAAES
jgi:molybdate transport system regulatory protein